MPKMLPWRGLHIYESKSEKSLEKNGRYKVKELVFFYFSWNTLTMFSKQSQITFTAAPEHVWITALYIDCFLFLWNIFIQRLIASRSESSYE